MSKRSGFRFLLFLIAAAILLIPSCKNSTGTTEEDVVIKTPVKIVPVTYRQVFSTVDLPAVTMFLNKGVVRATTTGTIENISVKPGDQVSRGQVLFSLKTREAAAIRNSASGDTSLSINGLINIRSGKSGIISTVSYLQGDFVAEGDELASISDQNSLVFIIEVPFELNSLIEKNKNCTITLPDNKKIAATITGRLPEMESGSQTMKYIARPVGSAGLPANMIASASLVTYSNENAALLPKPAVLGNETQTDFWVMKLINDSTAVKVPVTKGYETADDIEITEPHFLPSDRIILEGNYGLQDTANISVIQE
jgi:hypothetical protein